MKLDLIGENRIASTNLFSNQIPDRIMKTPYTESLNVARESKKWGRAEAVKLVSDFETRKQPVSQREFAKTNGIARSTLRHWKDRKNSIDADPVLIDFFENPVGLVFLHRLVTSAHVSFTKAGPASIHNVSDFLKKSGLSAFVASSYSSQRRLSQQIDENIIEFGNIEDNRLGQQMPTKLITLCEDETFHPEICLVAMEPVSNFILVEKYALNREAKTWNEAVNDALSNLPVEVIQVTSDEGRSLISHALKGLKVHHSPDCFHVIYEIGRGTCGALMSKVRQAEKEYEKMVKQTHIIKQKKDKFDNADKRPRGRRPNFEKKIEEAEIDEQSAKKKWDQASLNHETVLTEKAQIGQVYHPYNLKTGQRQDEELDKAAIECAQLFQRSSSCVEGRNAQLALRHQGIHRLNDRQLKAYTIMHNYYIRRRDGTTAAERFFNAKPNDLFEYLLDHVDYPVRPRKLLKSVA